MNIHVGKAILKRLEETGISKSEFSRRINRAPQTVQHIFKKPSIDTNLLLSISEVLSFNFFVLFVSESKQLGDISQPKDKLAKLTSKNEELTKLNKLLNERLKDKDKLIEALTKNQQKSRKK